MIINQSGEACLRNSSCYFGGDFHFLLFKLGYSDKTNNPNDSPGKRRLGFFSCSRSGGTSEQSSVELPLAPMKSFSLIFSAQAKPPYARHTSAEFFVGHFHQKSHRGAIAPLWLFWSKWRDSNSRPPVPEQIRHRFLTTFVDFLVLFSPKMVLSDDLVSTVST